MNKPTIAATVPALIFSDRALTPNQKLLYGWLLQQRAETGCAYFDATNEAIAHALGFTTKVVSRWITDLAARGYLHLEYNDRKNFRKIFLA